LTYLPSQLIAFVLSYEHHYKRGFGFIKPKYQMHKMMFDEPIKIKIYANGHK
jgi:hypothetical protein